MPAPKGYSLAQIRLHWIVAALILLQILFREPMAEAWDARREGGPVALSAGVAAHVAGGLLVLAFALWRLVLRRRHGAPPPPETEPAPLRLAATLAHWTLYGLMVLVPLSGALAWFGGIAAAAEAHQVLKNLLLLVVLVHVLAALWHQFWLKDDLLDRMRRPRA